MEKQKRLAILLTHPIQYYVPFLRKIAEQKNIYAMTYYLRNTVTKPVVDKEFGRPVTWDIPLLEGYDSEFLPFFNLESIISSLKQINYGLFSRLRAGKFDFILVFGFTKPFRMFGIFLSYLMGIKVLVRDDANLVARQRSATKMFFKKLFFVILNPLVFRFLAVGTRNKEYYLAHGIPASKILIMSWAIDNEFFHQRAIMSRPLQDQLRRDLGIVENQPVLLYVGKFSERKGILDLLPAFTTAYEALDIKPALVFVGDGDLRGEIEKAMLNCAGIKIAGFKNQTELPLYYELCDLMILPSKRLETWGLVINEAMSVGRPAIVSDTVGCAPDLILPDKTGWVFEDGNIPQLTVLLKTTLQSREKLRGMQEDCRRHISDFSIEQNLQVLNGIVLEKMLFSR